VRREAPYWASTLPQLPRLAHRLLAQDRLGAVEQALERLRAEQSRRNRLLAAVLAVLATGLAVQIVLLFA
jgi:ubiquinone biosynthesis protein